MELTVEMYTDIHIVLYKYTYNVIISDFAFEKL